jgi:hypothetical protein
MVFIKQCLQVVVKNVQLCVPSRFHLVEQRDSDIFPKIIIIASGFVQQRNSYASLTCFISIHMLDE